MIFADYPEISREDYKLPEWVEPELMYRLASSKDVRDKKVHDYIILSSVKTVVDGKLLKKFSAKQINRMLYLSKYSSFRLRERMREHIKGCDFLLKK